MGTTKSKSARLASSEAIWFTAAQLAQRWQVNPMTIRRWHYNGKLRGRTFGRGVIRFSQSDVLAFEQEA
jgi:predicted site-specific integrase-resolvase